jgi:hypothetical protein
LHMVRQLPRGISDACRTHPVAGACILTVLTSKSAAPLWQNGGNVMTTSATTWSGGACVDRLEGGWLTSPEAQGVGGGTPAEWAEERHRVARYVWEQLPESRGGRLAAGAVPERHAGAGAVCGATALGNIGDAKAPRDAKAGP